MLPLVTYKNMIRLEKKKDTNSGTYIFLNVEKKPKPQHCEVVSVVQSRYVCG